MSYLVTGGAGFIGSYVVRGLLKKEENVVVYDLTPEENSIQQILTKQELNQIVMIKGDVVDIIQLMNIIKEYEVKKIIHLAYLLIPDSNRNPSLAVKVNCQGFNNVLEAARVLELKKVVWASSAAVFGPPEYYTDEYLADDAPHHPVSVYGACKSLNEYMASYYFDKFKVDNVGLRFTAVYGLGRIRGASAFATELIEKPALGKPAKVPCGDDTIDWQYVEDASKAILLAIKSKKTKTRIFNTRGDLRSIKEAAKYIQRLIPGADVTLKPGKFGIIWKYKTRRIEQELGFKPEYSMEKGIKKTVNILRQKADLPLI